MHMNTFSNVFSPLPSLCTGDMANGRLIGVLSVLTLTDSRGLRLRRCVDHDKLALSSCCDPGKSGLTASSLVGR